MLSKSTFQEQRFGLMVETFLHFFGYAELEVLGRTALKRGWTAELKELERLLPLRADELSRKVNPWGDECDQLLPINVFLWKQKIGEISHDLRLLYEFDGPHNAWLPHRYMIANGYEEDALLLRHYAGSERKRYRKEALRLLSCYRDREMRDDPTDLAYLAICLSVLGPKLADDPLREQAWEFIDYIVNGIDGDTDTQLVGAADFTLLIHDLAYPAEASWPAYELFVTKSESADLIWSFPAWFIGPKVYGKRALEALREVDLPIDWVILEELFHASEQGTGAGLGEPDRWG